MKKKSGAGEKKLLSPPLFFRNPVILTGFVIACITFLIYLPALQNGFVNWDDDTYVYDNIKYIDIGFFKWVLTAVVAANWHPLTIISFAIDYRIWGLDPFGYHLTNIIFHSFNTFLVCILSIHLISYANLGKDYKKAFFTGCVTAILFGVHPLHVESVAWVSERKDVLCAFFFLLSILSYHRYATGLDSKKLKYYILSLIFFTCALTSKPMAVSLPIVLLILDYYPYKRLSLQAGLRSIASFFIEKIPFFIIGILSAAVTLRTQLTGEAISTLDSIPFIVSIMVAAHSYLFYIIKMFLPFNLAPLYPYPSSNEVFTSLNEYIVAFVVLIVISYTAIRLLKKNNPYSAAWLYYTVTILPVIGIVKVGTQATADRYSYLPSLGLFLIVGIGFATLYERHSGRLSRMFITVLFVCLAVLFAGKTIKQIGVWQNSVELWSHEIKIYPRKVFRAYYNRGMAFKDEGRYRESLRDLDVAFQISPREAFLFTSRGNVKLAAGNYDEALEDYKIAIILDPEDAEVYYNLGVLLDLTGAYKKSIENYDIAIELTSKTKEAIIAPQIYNSRGKVFAKMGLPEKAIADYNKAIELDKRYAEPYNNIGNLFLSLGRGEEALKNYNRAIEIDPAYANSYYNLGVAYRMWGNNDKAIYNYSLAIELNPLYGNAYANRGSTYKNLSRYDEAIEDFNKAIDLDDGNINAHYNRGITFNMRGEKQRAIDDFERIVWLNPKDAEVYYLLGMIYSEIKDEIKADENLKKSAELGFEPAINYLEFPQKVVHTGKPKDL